MRLELRQDDEAHAQQRAGQDHRRGQRIAAPSQQPTHGRPRRERRSGSDPGRHNVEPIDHCSGTARPALRGIPGRTRPSPSMDLDRALAFSRYAQRTLAAQPALADWLDARLDAPFDWGPPQRDIAAATDAGDAAALARTLRQWRAKLMLHTLARDLTGRADLTEVCAAVTTLADVAIGAAVRLHHRALAADVGEPIGAESSAPQALVVVGMGKLGGAELNVSSDVDLVFLYPEDRRDRRPAAAVQPRVLRAARPARHRRAARGHRRRLRVPRRHAAAPLRRQRPARRAVLGARAVPDHAGPRLGALRVAQGARAHRRRGRRARGDRHAVRVPQVPRLRRLRGPARTSTGRSASRVRDATTPAT